MPYPWRGEDWVEVGWEVVHMVSDGAQGYGAYGPVRHHVYSETLAVTGVIYKRQAVYTYRDKAA